MNDRLIICDLTVICGVERAVAIPRVSAADIFSLENLKRRQL